LVKQTSKYSILVIQLRCKEEKGGKVWCLVGDLNAVRTLEERNGVNQVVMGWKYMNSISS